MNKLDLVKVGKSFGFSVPPRVNLNIAPGAGKSETSHNKRKRKQDASDESEPEDEVEEETDNRPELRGRLASRGG